MNTFKRICFQVKTLWKWGLCSLLLFVSGCSNSIDPKEVENLFRIKKENCWPCTMYKITWEAIGDLIIEMFPVLCKTALDILGIGLLFWITFTVGKMIAALKEPNLKDFITNMATVLFKAFLVAAVLYNSQFVYDILSVIVTPTLEAFIQISRNIMFADPTIAKNFAVAETYTNIASDSTIFTTKVGNQLQDLIYRVYLGFHSGIGLGAKMMATLDFTTQMLGLIVIFIFFYLMLMFPLLFIEGFMLLGAVIFFFPFFLVAYVFPSTKGYLTSAWKVLFVSMAQIVLTCVYMAIMLTVIRSYADDTFSIGAQLTDPMLLVGLKNMQQQGLAFFALVFVMFKMTSDIPSISAKLVSDFNRSAISRGIQQVANIGKSLGLFAAGMAISGTGIGTGVGKAMMAKATKDAGKTMNDAFSPNGGENTGDGISDAQKASTQVVPKQPK